MAGTLPTGSKKIKDSSGKEYWWDPATNDVYRLYNGGSFALSGGTYYKVNDELAASLRSANASITGAQNAIASSNNSAKIVVKGLDPVSRPPVSNSVLRYPHENNGGGIAADADYMMFRFYDYVPPYSTKSDTAEDYNQSANYGYQQASSKFKTIIMYMPEDISTGFRAGWTGKSMANTTADALRSFGRGTVGEAAKTAAEGTVRLLERSGALVGAAAIQSIVKAVSGDSLSYDDIFAATSGNVLNPNTELLFNNIDLRNFGLNFKFAPRDDKEAQGCLDIVDQFKKAMLPSTNPGEVLGFNKNNDNSGITLGFIGVPKLCRVSFMSGQDEHPYLPRFKMCAITSVDVNYTPDGAYATFHDGRPVAMSLSLNFQETKICFAEDLENKGVR